MARILITGAEGGLGRAWARRLGAAGLSLEPAFKGPVEVIPCPKGKLDVAAVNDASRVLDEAKPDIVLNCAGRTDLEFCEASPWEAMRVNRDGADRIARACDRLGALPVYFSTDLVFDGGKLQPYGEEDPPNPLNAYGESKLAGELGTAAATRRHLIVRTGWIFGQPGRHFLAPLHGNAPFEAINLQVGQATWVEDFMDGVLFLLRKGKTGRWHVSSPGAVTQSEVVAQARERLGGGPPSWGRSPNAKPRLPGMTSLDGSKMEAAGHNMPGWEEGLNAYIKTMSKR